jgi:hypothetical protein
MNIAKPDTDKLWSLIGVASAWIGDASDRARASLGARSPEPMRMRFPCPCHIERVTRRSPPRA